MRSESTETTVFPYQNNFNYRELLVLLDILIPRKNIFDTVSSLISNLKHVPGPLQGHYPTFNLSTDKDQTGPYQEEEHVIVVGGVVLVVHAESSVYMAQVVMVIQLSERIIGQLCFAMEALEQMVT